jgi:hypothetical protein
MAGGAVLAYLQVTLTSLDETIMHVIQEGLGSIENKSLDVQRLDKYHLAKFMLDDLQPSL